MRELKNNVEQASSLSNSNVAQASSLLKKHRQDACSTLIKTVAIVAIFAICVSRSIADKEAEYALASMERLEGKAIMLPEVVAQLGVIRYAEATNNQKMIDRVVALYKAAYLEDGCLNRLSSGYIESQATAIIPLELYRITGDKSLLKDCWRIVQGQMRNPQKGGVYRHATWKGDDLFVISFLQNAANRVYGQ